MKRCYFIVFACLSHFISFTQNNEAVLNNGKWNVSSTWALGHSPRNDEIAIVPAGTTLIIDNNEVVSSNISLRIYGNMVFDVGKLNLTSGSGVYVHPGGTISSLTGTPADRIVIGGVTKYQGTEGTLSGPIMASSLTTGFDPMPITLPVQFIAYGLSKVKNGIAITWSTTEEINAAFYTIERSVNASSWQAIGHIAAAQKSAIINNYSYTDKALLTGIAYYRVKQVDVDGHFTYSAVRSVSPEPVSLFEIKLSSQSNSLIVEFSKQLKGNVVMRLMSMSGQVVASKTYYQPAGNIILPGVYKGQYILTIHDDKELKITKQVYFN